MRRKVQQETSKVVAKSSRVTSTTRPCSASFGRERDRVNEAIEPVPLRGDFVEDRLHLPWLRHVERHDDARLELFRERLDVFLRLVVDVSDRNVRSERSERLGATPGDRAFVRDSDDQTLFALEQLCLRQPNPARGEAIADAR